MKGNANAIIYSLIKNKDIDMSIEEKDPLLDCVFFSKYKTILKLGEGSFGKVYKAIYDGEYYALKMEDASQSHNLLEIEATILEYLQGPNIPKFVSYGYNKAHNILIMQLLDKSLDEFFCQLKSFSIKTTAMLGYQMINILKYIHDKHIIHRDIKPDNFAMGPKELNANLYIVDFGLAKKYRSSRTLKQLPLTKRKGLTGTARYASINALQGYEQSRRDDLESVGYVLMYFLRGNLPWQNIKSKTKDEKYQSILKIKKDTSSKELGKNFPSEFSEILDYFKKLEYEENPDYSMCCNKLLSVLEKEKLKFDYVYDWTTYANLKERIKLKKKSNRLRSSVIISSKNVKENKNLYMRKYSINHCIEDIDDFEKAKITIMDKNKTKKKSNSNISNKANIDENDMPGIIPENELCCCTM
jgi:serine/threonine protein kinase